MSGELFKIILTSCLTIIGGIFIYTVGQIISKFFIEPIHEQKKIIAEINDVLIFYANQFYLYSEKDDNADKIVDKIRSLSTELRARTSFIPCYRMLSRMKWVLKEERIQEACTALIGLSNSVYKTDHSSSHIESYRDKIAQSLGMRI